METKYCKGCSQEKPISEFYKGRSKQGLQYFCKECCKKSATSSKKSSKGELSSALSGVNRTPKFDPNNPLSAFAPRDLIAELKKRGYRGNLTYTHILDLEDF